MTVRGTESLRYSSSMATGRRGDPVPFLIQTTVFMTRVNGHILVYLLAEVDDVSR